MAFVTLRSPSEKLYQLAFVFGYMAAGRYVAYMYSSIYHLVAWKNAKGDPVYIFTSCFCLSLPFFFIRSLLHLVTQPMACIVCEMREWWMIWWKTIKLRPIATITGKWERDEYLFLYSFGRVWKVFTVWEKQQTCP